MTDSGRTPGLGLAPEPGGSDDSTRASTPVHRGPRWSWLKVTGSVGPLGIATAVLWLSIIVLLPLAALTVSSFEDGWSGFWDAITAPAALDSLRITVLVSIIVAVLIVFIIPFILEPYTMRPRKPGFLERELAKDEDDEE